MILIALASPSMAVARSAEHFEAAAEREDLGAASLFRPSSPLAGEAMSKLLCQCPGCQAKRITILDCACRFAAKQREEVLAVLAGEERSTRSSRRAALQRIADDQVRRYGDGVIASPSSATVWFIPLAVSFAGLGGLLLLGRGWRKLAPPEKAPMGGTAEDESLAERLDDELAEVT